MLKNRNSATVFCLNLIYVMSGSDLASSFSTTQNLDQQPSTTVIVLGTNNQALFVSVSLYRSCPIFQLKMSKTHSVLLINYQGQVPHAVQQRQGTNKRNLKAAFQASYYMSARLDFQNQCLKQKSFLRGRKVCYEVSRINWKKNP